jgi:hypothetical protein
MESQIQEAIKYIQNFPDTKIAKVAQEFKIPVSRLRPPKVGQPAKNTKLLRAEEAALCRYIDWLDNINLAVTEFQPQSPPKLRARYFAMRPSDFKL